MAETPWSPEGAKFYTAAGREDPAGSLVNMGSDEQKKLVPMRHAQPTDPHTGEAHIPQRLLGGVTRAEQLKFPLQQAVNELVAQLKRIKRMSW